MKAIKSRVKKLIRGSVKASISLFDIGLKREWSDLGNTVNIDTFSVSSNLPTLVLTPALSSRHQELAMLGRASTGPEASTLYVKRPASTT